MLRLALKNSPINKNQTPLNVWTQCHRHRTVHSGTPAKSRGGFGKYIVILTPLAIGGGVVAYAKYDNKFRQTLVNNVPGIDPVLKVFYQEENNALTKVKKSIDSASQSVINAKDSVTGFFGGGSKDEPTTKAVPTTKKIEITSKPSSKQQDVPAVPAPPLQKPPVPASDAAKPVAITQSKPTPSSEPISTKSEAPKLPSSLVELEQALDIAVQTALKDYNKAINYLKSYNEDVKRVVDEAIEKSDNVVWNQLKNKTGARDAFIEAAEISAQKTRKHLDQLGAFIEHLRKDHAPAIIENVQRTVKTMNAQLDKCKDELYNAKDTAKLSEKYWRKVESARNYFFTEVESLFDINLNEKTLNMSKDDLDLFLLHAHSHVLAYQKELQRLHTEGEVRLQRAIDAARNVDSNDNDLIKSQVEYHLEKEKRQLHLDNQKKFFRIQTDSDKSLRHQLKKHAEAHSDHLTDALQQKENELRRVFNRELNETLSIEQTAYRTQLAAMLGKVKGMNDALKDRADADRRVHQAQSLWSACQALWASVRAGDPTVSWHYQLRPLSNEVAAVSRAAEGDELVAVVLNGVPAEAKSRGVYPEDALRERFIHVEKLARRLAIVPEHGASLPIYVLSYIQSMFILQPENPISIEELNNEPVDFNKFDTYDILNKARYWIDRGNLMQALKYMNLLNGASRKIASDWIKEARLLLETQQAANTLMSHAAASGLSFL